MKKRILQNEHPPDELKLAARLKSL